MVKVLYGKGNWMISKIFFYLNTIIIYYVIFFFAFNVNFSCFYIVNLSIGRVQTEEVYKMNWFSKFILNFNYVPSID